MVPISLSFWYAYSSTEYSLSARPSGHRLSLPKAILDAINPYDLFAGIGRMVPLYVELRRTGGFKAWRDGRKRRSARVPKHTESTGQPLGQYHAVGDDAEQSRHAEQPQEPSRGNVE